MKLANKIQESLMRFAKGTYDVILPNFFYGYNECDLFRITSSDYIVEYEIKISRSDFFNDLEKKASDCKKHDILKSGVGKYCPNRFFFVVPERLVSIDEVPKYAGLLYCHGNWFDIKKNAPLIHKRKVELDIYRDICRTLSSRDHEQRKRIKQIRNTDFDKEMAAMKREVDRAKADAQRYSVEAMMYRRLKRKQDHNEFNAAE